MMEQITLNKTFDLCSLFQLPSVCLCEWHLGLKPQTCQMLTIVRVFSDSQRTESIFKRSSAGVVSKSITNEKKKPFGSLNCDIDLYSNDGTAMTM